MKIFNSGDFVEQIPASCADSTDCKTTEDVINSVRGNEVFTKLYDCKHEEYKNKITRKLTLKEFLDLPIDDYSIEDLKFIVNFLLGRNDVYNKFVLLHGKKFKKDLISIDSFRNHLGADKVKKIVLLLIKNPQFLKSDPSFFDGIDQEKMIQLIYGLKIISSNVIENDGKKYVYGRCSDSEHEYSYWIDSKLNFHIPSSGTLKIPTFGENIDERNGVVVSGFTQIKDGVGIIWLNRKTKKYELISEINGEKLKKIFSVSDYTSQGKPINIVYKTKSGVKKTVELDDGGNYVEVNKTKTNVLRAFFS